MQFRTHRKAFSMLTAIIIIVIMATVGAMVMNLSGSMVKETTTQFQREQAMLLAKSYTEYAIMAVMANAAASQTKTVQNIYGRDVIRAEANGGFAVATYLSFIGNGNGRINNCWGTRKLSNTGGTARYPLHVIIDVYVKYRGIDSPNRNWITYHKRTLQKI